MFRLFPRFRAVVCFHLPCTNKSRPRILPAVSLVILIPAGLCHVSGRVCRPARTQSGAGSCAPYTAAGRWETLGAYCGWLERLVQLQTPGDHSVKLKLSFTTRI